MMNVRLQIDQLDLENTETFKPNTSVTPAREDYQKIRASNEKYASGVKLSWDAIVPFSSIL